MKQEEDIKKAVEVMRQGGIILYPTDTIWGIGCDATNADAVKKVYDIKQRDDSKALICLVDSVTSDKCLMWHGTLSNLRQSLRLLFSMAPRAWPLTLSQQTAASPFA